MLSPIANLSRTRLSALNKAASGGGAKPVNLTPPVIYNTLPSQGGVLTISEGSWTNSPTHFDYQWYRDSSPIATGGTSSTYTPVMADVGHALKVQVAASNGVGVGTPAFSDPTSNVLPTIAFRPQAHQFQPGGTIARVNVSVAGLFTVNGDYYNEGTPGAEWLQTNTGTLAPSTIGFNGGVSQWSITDGSSMAGAYYAAGVDVNDDLGTLTWLSLLPIYDPAPTVTQQDTPYALPLGLFQDDTGTTPCVTFGDPVGNWTDELSGSGLAAIQSNTMKQPLMQFVYNVAAGMWLPTVVFDGVDDLLATTSFTTQTSITFLAGCARPWTDRTNFHKPWCKGLADDETDGIAIIVTGPSVLGFDWVSGDILALGSGYASASDPRAIGPMPTTADGTRVCFSITLSSTVAETRLDGSVISTRVSVPATLPVETEPAYIGANFGGISQHWDGSIDCVMVALLAFDSGQNAEAETYVETLG